MAAADVVFFQERLASKEQELGELKSAFHKYKLKQKVKYDNLKKDVYAYCRSTGQAVEETENIALLQIKVAEMETELEEARARVENLTEELDRSQEQLKDQMTVIRSMENSLKEMSPSREARDSKFDKKSAQVVDMERIQQQMLYKDQRIIELNNNILEKERQILDLQEMCREQGEVADAKKQAMRLVQKKFEEMESRNRREVGTETDPWFPTRERDSMRGGRTGGVSRSLSPGHAVVSRAAGGSSPPPLDPQLQNGETVPRFDEDDMLPGTSSAFQGRNLDEEISLRTKQKKRVTFDLPPSLAASSINLNEGDDVLYVQLNETIARLTEENNKLMADVEYKNSSLTEARKRLEDNEHEISRLLRDTKSSNLKARAVAHSRIRELEESLAELNQEHLTEVNRLSSENETLRSTREWEVEENGKLRDHIDKLREKNNKLTAELDATGILNRELEKKLDDTQALLEGVTTELCEAEELVIFLEDQKEGILDDVEKMKEAIFAQDQFIDLLEADIVIYEEHVGLLRDSLGASKVDHRALLRSKAFETKLKALEQEKEQISLKSREEKLKTKALAQKVKLLEEENEKLMEKLCEKEMGAADDDEMDETCRQLEARLLESEENMKIERARFEIEMAGQRVENKQRLAECEELRFRIYALENQQREQQSRGNDQHHLHHQQTQLVQAAGSQETEQLREKVTEQEAKIRELVQNITCLETELDAVRGTNFELTDRIKECDELERDYDNLVEKHRHTCVELVSAKETLEKLQTEAVDPRELENLVERATGAEEEVNLLRKELEEARQAVVVQKEVDTSKIEAQTQQRMTADEEIQLRQDFQLATAKLAETEAEKQELRLLLDRVQEMEYVKATERKESRHQEALDEQREALEQAVERHKAAEEQLLVKVNDLELEASLAGELSVEMGRVIQQFEKQIKEQELNLTKAEERAHGAEMELRLHEMLNEELGRQLDELKERGKAHEKQIEELEQYKTSSEELENQMKEGQEVMRKNQKELEAAKKKNFLLVQQIQELEEKLTTSVNLTKEANVELAEKKETVQQVEGELKGMRQEQGEQQIQRVVQQVQQAPPQESQHNRSWNWGQAGYSPPYLLSETTVAPQNQQPEAQVQAIQPHYHHQPAGTVSQESSQGHGHSHSHSHEPQNYQQGHSYQEHHGHSHPQHQHPHDYQESGQDYSQNYARHQEQSQGHVHPSQATVSHDPGHHHHHEAHVHFAEPVETSADSEGPATVAQNAQSRESFVEQVQSENELLRQCVNETIQLREDMTQDVEKLLELKNELEVAVDALKGEIWTLNGQLKASILDRENLQDRVVELDTSLADERKKVASLDVELSEQQELTEKATRQAAEAENESNRRLAECHEMESRRIELEQAYSQLTEYYNQLQAAYNLIYAQQQQGTEGTQIQESPVPDSALLVAINSLLEELSLPILDVDIRSKLNAIQEKIREKMMEVEQLHSAVAEQHKVARALESRLEAVEEEKETSGGAQLEWKNRVEQLEGDLEWKQEECDSLRRQVDELQHALNTIIVNDGDDAARLATRQADVDSLFRTNAELAHTNVRLQNELDDREEEVPVQTGGEGGDEAQILAEKVQQLEQKLAEWTDSKEEIERLKNIEKILNNRILSLEDQLLEKEEQLQEMEEQIIKNQGSSTDSDRLRVLEQANFAVISELEELRQERDTLRANIEIMEKDREIRKEEARLKEEELKSREEEIKQYEEEMDELKTEIIVIKQKIQQKEEGTKIERVQPTQSAWGEWDEKENEEEGLKEKVEQLEKELKESQRRNEQLDPEEAAKLRSELGQLKEKLDSAQEEQETLKLRNTELEEELTFMIEANQKKEKEDAWEGWEEKKESDEDLEVVKNRLEIAQQEQEELKLRNMDLEEELVNLLGRLEAKEKKADWQQEAKDHAEEVKQLQEEVEELKGLLDSSQQAQEDLKLKNYDLAEEVLLLKGAQETKEEAWGDWEEQKDNSEEVSSLQQEVEDLKSRLDESQQEQEGLKLRNMELAEELTKLKEKQPEEDSWREDWNEKSPTENDEELKRLQEEVNELKDRLERKEQEQEGLKERNALLESNQRLEDEKELEEELEELQGRLDKSQQDKEDLKLKNTQLEEELVALREQQGAKEETWGEWDQKSEEETRLRKELEDLKGRLDSAQGDQEALKLRNTELEEELAFLLEANQKKVNESKQESAWGEWEEKKDSSQEVETLQQEITSLSSALNTLQQEQQLLKARNTALEEEMASLLKEKEEKGGEEAWGDWEEKPSTEKPDDLSQEVAGLQAELQEKDQTLKEFMEEINDAKEELEEKEKKIQDLVEQLAKAPEKKEENWGDGWTEGNEELEQLKVENEELRTRLEQLEISENESRRQLQKLKASTSKPSRKDWSHEQNEVEKLKHELEERDRERSKLEAVIMRVEKENEDLMGQLEDTQLEDKTKKKENDMTYTLFEFQQEIQRLREENSRLQVETTQNVQSAADAASTSDELMIQKQKEELEDAQNKLSAMATTLQSVENNFLITRDEAQRRQSELETRVHSLEEELQAAQSGAEELAAKEERLMTLEKRLTEVEKQNNLLKESEGRLLENVDEYGALADKNQEEVDRLQKVVNSLEEERARLLEELDQLRAEIQRLKAVPQPREEDPALKQELEALRIERDSLKDQLSAMEEKLAEIEKEKSQIKAAYDLLRAKIQARRAAAAAGGSNPSSRAPSRASVASIGEIREDPVELTYQETTARPAQTLHVQANHSYSQEIDDRVQHFVAEVKEFMSRVDSIATVSQANIEEVDRNLDHLMSRHPQKKSPLKESMDAQPQTSEMSVQTDRDPALLDPEEVEEMENTIMDLELKLDREKMLLAETNSRHAEFMRSVVEEDKHYQQTIRKLTDKNEALKKKLHDNRVTAEQLDEERNKWTEEFRSVKEHIEKMSAALERCLQENTSLTKQLEAAKSELQQAQGQEPEVQLDRVEMVQGAPPLPVTTYEVSLSHEEEVEQVLLEAIEKLETDLDDVGLEKEVILEEWDKLKEELEETRMKNVQLEEDIRRHVVKEAEQRALEEVKENELELIKVEQETLKQRNVELEMELSALMAAKELENIHLQMKEEEIKQYGEELDQLKVEIIAMEQKMTEKEEEIKVERVQQTQSAWGEWEERENEDDDLKLKKAFVPEEAASLAEELDQLKKRLDSAQVEQEKLQLKNVDLEEELTRMREANTLQDQEKRSEEEKQRLWIAEQQRALKELIDLLEISQQEQEDLIQKNTILEREFSLLQTEKEEQEVNNWDEWQEQRNTDTEEIKKLEREVESLQEELNECHVYQEDLKTTLVELEEELSKNKEACLSLEESKVNVEKRHQMWMMDRQQQLKELVELLVQSQQEQEELASKNSVLEEELVKLQEEKIDEKEVSVWNSWGEGQENMSEELEKRQKEIESLKEELKRKEDEQQELNDRIAQLEEELGLLTSKNKKETTEVTCEMGLDDKKEEVESLKIELEELKLMNSDLEDQITSHQEQLHALTLLLEESRREQEILIKKNGLFQKALEDIDEVSRAYSEQENRAGELEKYLEEAKKEVTAREEELEQTRIEREELEAKIEELNGRLQSMEPVKEENSRLSEELSSTQTELAALSIKIRELQLEQSRVQSEKVEKSVTEDENSEIIEALEKENEHLEKQLLDLSEKLKNEREDAKQKATVLEGHQKEAEQLRYQIDELQKEIISLSSAKDSEKKELLQEKDSHIQRLQNEVSQMKLELTTSLDKIDQLEAEISRFESEKEKFFGTSARQKEEAALDIAEVKKKMTGELEEQQRQSEELRSQLADLTEEAGRLSSEKDELLQEKESSEKRLQLDVSQLTEELAVSLDKILQLEAQITQLESEKEQALEASTKENEEKTLDSQKVQEELQQQTNEWRQRFELAYADLCQLHPILQQAQEHASHLMVQNAELLKQIEQKSEPPVEEEKSRTSETIHPVESAPAILQLEETLQAGPITRESTTETRINMEQEEEKTSAGPAEKEDDSSSDTRPLLSHFDDFLDQNSHFIRAGAPITQPLMRQLRAIWGRRAFRPYFRYLLTLYFVFVHFLVFSSWFNPC